MEVRSIYNFSDPAEFLRTVFSQKKQINPKVSLRGWAKQMGLKNHVLLSLILNNKRKLTPQIAVQLRRGLKLKATEQRYFDLLVLFISARTEDMRLLFQEELRNLHPKKEFSVLDLDRLRFLSDWAHLCVWQMLQLKNFKPDAAWISKRTQEKITPAAAQEILKRLERLGVIEKSADGRLKNKMPFWRTPHDVPSTVIRKIHAQLLEQAARALETQDISEREFSSYTLAVKQKDIPAAKEMIREFRKQFGQRFDVEQGDEVHVLGIQFFKLTQGDKNESH
jgi:uncharacterized protein (TIGR02147 family)